MALTAGGILAACGSSSGGSTAVGGDLVLFTWEGYDMKKPLASWLKTNDITEKSLGFLNINSDALTKLSSPAGRRIDVTSMNTSYMRYAYEQGLTSAVTTEDVPELNDLYPFFKRTPLFQKGGGEFYSVPWTWGYTAITYRPSAVPPPKSYQDILDPKYEGRIGTIDDFVQNVVLSCVALGIDPDTLTKTQLFGPVLDFMKRVVASSKTIVPGVGDQVNVLVSGDVDYMFVGLTLLDALAKEQGVTTKTVLPQEGGGGFTDGVAISANAPNRANAIAFARQFISPTRRAGEAQTSIFGATTTPKVVPHISPSVRNLYPYKSLDALLKQIVMPAGWPHEPKGDLATFDDTVKAWEEAKASA